MIDISSDLLLSDGLDSFELQPSGGAPQELTGLRQKLSTKVVRASEGEYSPSDSVFMFSALEVGQMPKVGDRISDGSVWVVLEVVHIKQIERVDLICRNLSNSLNSTFDLLEASYSIGEDGDQMNTWTPVLSGLPGKIQAKMVDRKVEHKREELSPVYTLFALDSFETADRRVLSGGKTFRILGASNFGDIGGLFEVELEEVT